MKLLACALAVGCSAPATTSAPVRASTQPDPAIEYGAPPDPACVGDHLELANLAACKCSGTHSDPDGGADLRAGIRCALPFYGRKLDGLVATQLDAVAPVHRGAASSVRLFIRNAGTERLPLILHGARTLSVEIVDHAGRDVTFAGECREGFSASGTDFLVTLTPNGTLELPIAWTAAARDLCHDSWVPLAAGRYKLVVRVHAIRDLPEAQATVSTLVDVLE